MRNRVKLKKSQLDYFRKLARQTPNEIQAFLVGDVVSPTLTVVDSFEYPPTYAKSNNWEVSWWVADYNEMQKKAEDRGKRVVGFIHSHPEWDAVLSPADYDFMIANGYRVCGICSTQGRKTRPRFWVMDTALSCVIEYAKRKTKVAEVS